jgi:NAD-dependent deacetylase
MLKKQVVVFTGAGISAESGIKTFRDAGGLWENYKIEDVATPEAWKKNQELVNEFYNARRKQVIAASPNKAHYFIADLESKFNVNVVTQNVDDFHERAGSKNVLHLHGEIMKVRSEIDPELIYPVTNWELKIGDLCEKGSQLRPHIVWFGELVPLMDQANYLAAQADFFIVIGTSLNVYPAAGILNFVSQEVPKWLIDPSDFQLDYIKYLNHIKSTAVDGLNQLNEQLKLYY